MVPDRQDSGRSSARMQGWTGQLGLARIAVLAAFILNGLNFSNWAARLPAVRDGLGFSPAQMGAIILFGAIGSVVALPLSGWVATRTGTRRAIVFAAAVNTAGYLVAVAGLSSGTVPILAAGLFMAGVGTALWDVAMNLEGTVVEQGLKRAIMPQFHAGFSLGTIVGTAIAGVMEVNGVGVPLHLSVVVCVTFVCAVVATRFFITTTESARASASAAGELARTELDRTELDPIDTAAPVRSGKTRPKRGRRSSGVFAAWLEPRTLLIGVSVLAAALTEGSANDWLALGTVDGFVGSDGEAVSRDTGAFSLTVFVTAMTAMRLIGTAALNRFGRVAVLRVSGAAAFVGLAIFGLAPADMLWLGLAGIVLWGIGAALGFPVGMSAAADDPLQAAARVSVVSSIGYCAFLAGPPLLGFIADHVGYRNALLWVLIPIAASFFVLPILREPKPEERPGGSTRLAG